MSDYLSLVLSGMILVVSGIFAKNENACQKDYFFASDIKITPTVTGTPDDDGNDDDTTPVGTPTVSNTTAPTGTPTPVATTSGSPTATPEVTAGARVPLGRVAKEIFSDVEQSNKARKVEDRVRSNVHLQSDGTLNWLGKQSDKFEDKADSDKDGFTDALEDTLGTDVKDDKSYPKSVRTTLGDLTKIDHDSDGLSPDDESALELSSTIFDTDNDGCGDGSEVLSFSDPKNGESFPSPDSDRDCLADEFETKWKLRVDRADTDQDGMSDAREVAFGTNPFSVDTDSDGILDGKEIAIGSNPLLADF